MKTREIFNKIYEDLKMEMQQNSEKTFVKEYEIPSMTYSKNENTEDLYWASGIEKELRQMMKNFDNKVYFSSYKDKYFIGNNEEKVKETMLKEVEKETLREQCNGRVVTRQDEKYKPKTNEKIENLKKQLEEKVNAEFKDFVENLKKCEPETIIDRAYEKVSKEEMIYKIIDKDYDKTELKALLKTEGILQECYDEWLKSDGNFNEVLEYAVDNRIDLIVEDYKKKQAKESRESR